MPAPTTVGKRTQLMANLGLFYSAAIWGATFYIVKDALSGIDPVMLVAYRFLLAGLLMLVFLLVTKRPVFVGLGRAALLSIILLVLYVSQTVGLKYTTASNSGFITGLFVLFVPIFLRTVFKRKPTLMEVLASVISLAGLWILTGGMRDVNVGDMLTLLAALTYALHVLYADKYMKAGVDAYVITCQQFLIIGLACLAGGLIFGLPLEIASVEVGWVVVFLALLPTLSAFLIQMVSQKFTSPLKVSLIFAFEPVFAGLFAWTLGGEEFVQHRALGGLFIFLALIVSGLPSPGKRRKD